MNSRTATTPSDFTGLTAEEAARRLAEHGPNEIPEGEKRSVFGTLREILTEPMLLLLLAAAAIYLVIGDLAEGLLLCGFAVMTIGLVLYQERRSENALAALKAMGAPRARVVRDGTETVIPAREVVPGDLFRIDEGERVPADGLLLAQQALVVDESLLTGESVPVNKAAAGGMVEPEGSAVEAGGEGTPYVFSGTLAVRGHGIARATATGRDTLAGSIGRSLASIVVEKTRLQTTVGAIVRIFGLIAVIVCGGLIAVYGLVYDDWLQGLLSGIALAMSLLPEEFAVVLAVFMAIGAWRLSRIHVLARRPAVIEMLGAATVLCVDKTGTLTENQMRVRMLSIDGDTIDVADDAAIADERFRELVATAWLAARHVSLDPMDRAVGALAGSTIGDMLDGYGDWPLVREYGISTGRLAFSQVWKRDDNRHLVATKGAPEAIADLCHLSKPQTGKLMAEVGELAARGLRVLAVASAETDGAAVPEDVHDYRFHLVGLVAFEDPVRKSVPGALAEARSAGIAVKMITGDYPATATAIATEAGIENPTEVLTGGEVEAMDAAALRQAVARYFVYARTMPEQKLALVTALKDDGEVVAMTGDGVNDAPALKSAHIGVAMGMRGTDVAREAAGIVLQNEDFGTILRSVKQGRRIFDNLRKAMIYIAAIHVPIAGLALVPLLAGMPPMLLPMHVVLLELLIDPMCSIAYETTPGERDIMKVPPRPLTDRLVGMPQLAFGIAQGLGVLAACLATYWWYLNGGASDGQSRALAFIALTAGNVGLARVNASRGMAILEPFARGYRAFWLISALATALVGACMTIPPLAAMFGFAVPGIGHVAIAMAAGLLPVLVFDLSKLLPQVGRIMGRMPVNGAA